MSLNCLTCGQTLQRTDSYENVLAAETSKNAAGKKVDRSWSVNMAPKSEVPKAGGGAVAKIKAEHRRNFSTGNISYSGSEPRLVRSSGMRRNWSFENLVENQDQNVVSCH